MIFVTTGKIKKLRFAVLKYTIFKIYSKLYIVNLLYGGKVENYTICSTVLIQTFFVVGITEVIPLSVITVCYSILLQYKFAISMFIAI